VRELAVELLLEFKEFGRVVSWVILEKLLDFFDEVIAIKLGTEGDEEEEDERQ
jgi:hypothetical protein